MVLIDKVWTLRNEVGHEGSQMEVEKLVRAIEVGSIAIKGGQNIFKTCYTSLCETVKYRMSNDIVILEGDVAVRETLSVVAKSLTKQLQAVFSKRIDDTSVLHGKICATLLALDIALQLGWRNIFIRPDSALAVEAIQKPEECRDWKWTPLLQDIHSILEKMKA